MNKYIKDLNLIIVGIFASLFFVGVVFYIGQINNDGLVKWLSPDENANYFFASLFANDGSLIAYDELNNYAEDIIRPRSFRSDAGELKPVSFLGIILIYGLIGGVLGVGVIPYITPVVAVLGLFVYYFLVRKLFGRSIALISAIILSFFPVYIYYSVRSMFHNILFLVLLLIGLYFLVSLRHSKEEKIDFKRIWKDFFRRDDEAIENLAISAFAGLFIGLALLTRTSELLWLGPLIVLLWVLNFKYVKFSWILVIVSFVLIGYSPAFYYNYYLYGSMWQGGYHEMNQSIVDVADVGSGLFSGNLFSVDTFNEGVRIIRENVFYFGFRSLESWQQFINYFMVMFYWIFWPAVFGLSHILENWKDRPSKERKFIIAYFWVLVFLMFYYGSWKFNDNPDITKITIGNSYTRYWLPIYLGAIPLVGLFVLKISRTLVTSSGGGYVNVGFKAAKPRESGFISSVNDVEASFKKFRMRDIFSLVGGSFRNWRLLSGFFIRAVCVVLVGVMCFLSVGYVLVGSEEGLVETFYKQKMAKEEVKEVYYHTDKNSVIITRYHDKMLFPERRVIVGLFDDKNMLRNYKKLTKIVPVYYFNFTLPEKDIEYLNTRRLKEFRMVLKKIRDVNSFSLYELRSW